MESTLHRHPGTSLLLGQEQLEQLPDGVGVAVTLYVTGTKNSVVLVGGRVELVDSVVGEGVDEAEVPF